MLDTLFGDELSLTEKIDVLTDDYGSEINNKLKEELNEMSNLSQGIFQKGFQKGFEKGFEIGKELVHSIRILLKMQISEKDIAVAICHEYDIPEECAFHAIRTVRENTEQSIECLIKEFLKDSPEEDIVRFVCNTFGITKEDALRKIQKMRTQLADEGVV